MIALSLSHTTSRQTWFSFPFAGDCKGAPIGTVNAKTNLACTYNWRLNKAITWECVSTIVTDTFPHGSAMREMERDNNEQTLAAGKVLQVAFDRCDDVSAQLPPSS